MSKHRYPYKLSVKDALVIDYAYDLTMAYLNYIAYLHCNSSRPWPDNRHVHSNGLVIT